MPIKPGSSLINIGGAGDVYIDELTYTFAVQDFDRLEFSNRRLREAPTLTGALPLIVPAFGGQPVQLLTTCTGDVARPLGPDDANISQIKKRWNIKKYTMRGAANSTGVVSSLFSMNQTHLKVLDGFALYLGELSMELSITFLQGTMQGYTFASITGGGTSISGTLVSASNVLLTDFDAIAEYEAPGYTTSYSFTATFENRTLDTQGPVN